MKKVLDQMISTTFDLSTFAAGNYLLQLSNADEQTIKTFKILKIK